MTADVRGVAAAQPAAQRPATGNAGMATLVRTLGQLGAHSPATAVSAQVTHVRPQAQGGFQVTLSLNGQTLTVPAPSPPGNPIQLYTLNGAVQVATLGGQRSNIQPPPAQPHLATLLSALGSPPPATAALLQVTLADPAMAGWAALLAQLTSPNFAKRWIGDSRQFEAMLSKLADAIPERGEHYLHQQEQRAIAGQEDLRQGLPTWRFDIPIQLGNRWIDGQATLQRRGPQGDVWEFQLEFELPKSGRVDVRVCLAPHAIDTRFRAERPGVLRRLGELTDPMAARLRQMGLPMQPITLAPWVRASAVKPADDPGSTLDIRV